MRGRQRAAAGEAAAARAAFWAAAGGGPRAPSPCARSPALALTLAPARALLLARRLTLCSFGLLVAKVVLQRSASGLSVKSLQVREPAAAARVAWARAAQPVVCVVIARRTPASCHSARAPPPGCRRTRSSTPGAWPPSSSTKGTCPTTRAATAFTRRADAAARARARVREGKVRARACLQSAFAPPRACAHPAARAGARCSRWCWS